MNSDRGSITERVKTSVIVLLTVSAAVLGWQTQLFNDFFSSLPFLNGMAVLMRSASGPIDEGYAVVKEAARPSCIVITGENGSHYGVRYNTIAKNTVYDRVSGVLGEALGSALEPREISQQKWRSALTSMGIYFEYSMPVDLSVLSGWFGAATGQSDMEFAIRRVCVTLGGEMNILYFQDERSGLFYQASTASTGGRELYLSVYAANGTVFAFESVPDASRYAPYMVLIPDSNHPIIRAVTPQNPQDALDLILSALGASSQIKPSYTDNNNALNYVGTQFTIRVSQNGHAVVQRTEDISADTNTANSLSVGQMIERARVITADTIGKTSDDAIPYYYNSFFGEDGSFTVTFEYHLAGGRVFMGDGSFAASITFSNSIVTHMEVNFKTYTVTEDTITLMPERQTLAAAQDEFFLCYNDTGADKLSPEWVRKLGDEFERSEN